MGLVESNGRAMLNALGKTRFEIGFAWMKSPSSFLPSFKLGANGAAAAYMVPGEGTKEGPFYLATSNDLSSVREDRVTGLEDRERARCQRK